MPNRRTQRLDLFHDDFLAYRTRRERVYRARLFVSDYWRMLLVVAGFGLWYWLVLA